MIWARDVIFNEDEIFNDDLEQMKNDCFHIELNELADLLTQLDMFSASEETWNSDSFSSEDDCIYIGNSEVLDEDIYEPEKQLDESSLVQLIQQALNQGLFDFYLNEFMKDQPYSTSSQSPPAALLAATIQGPENSDPIETFHTEANGRQKV